MKPRRLGLILNLPIAQRFDFIASGLDRISCNVSRLASDAKALEADGRPRGSNVVGVFMLEEAAKMFILLDLVRASPSNGQVWAQTVKRFYDHLARCIYARVYSGNPANFGEVRRYVDVWRRSHHLDGPNDVDWIFRNDLIAGREDSLYVDLIETEDGAQWFSPSEDEPCYISMTLPDLVAAVMRTGIGSRLGLDVVHDSWSRFAVTDETHWAEIASLNEKVLERAFAQNLQSDDVSQQDVNTVYNSWTFPLGGLEMAEVKVDLETLKATRQAVSDQMTADYLGIDPEYY